MLSKITSFNRGVTKYGKAPHKPILLLAVVDGFEKGYLKKRSLLRPKNCTCIERGLAGD